MKTLRLTDGLLAGPARRAARVVARSLLRNLVRERARLARQGVDDPDALHDFRTALRRLRSWLRAWRPWLEDTVRGRERRSFASFADATNDARDAEVSLAWLATQRDGLPAGSRAGALLLTRLTRDRLRRSTREFDRRLSRDFNRTARRLDRDLSYYRVDVPTGRERGEPAAAAITAELIRSHAGQLGEALRRVRTERDVAAAHAARIAGKRLRYLLEPLAADRQAAAAVDRLTGMQDVLGEFHDAHVLADRIAAVRAAMRVSRATPAAARRPLADPRDARPGLDALAARSRDRAALAFPTFEREWLGGGADALVAAAMEVAGRIESRLTIAPPIRTARHA